MTRNEYRAQMVAYSEMPSGSCKVMWLKSVDEWASRVPSDKRLCMNERGWDGWTVEFGLHHLKLRGRHAMARSSYRKTWSVVRCPMTTKSRRDNA